MTERRFVHTLSFPEHLWLDFFRVFFAQDNLVIDEDGRPVTNNFKYEESQIPENRRFDILLERDMKGNNPDILPTLVLEDMGEAALGVGLNRLATWTVIPETTKTRSDLLRSTYVMHCCARTSGESRLLAAIVSNALIVFYDELLRVGFHKLEPWSIGKTTPVKSDSDYVYSDTPVQVTFEYQQTWKTVEDGSAFFKRFCMRVVPDEISRYVRLSMDISDAATVKYVAMSMNLENPNASIYVNTSIDLVDPAREESYVIASMDVVDPESVDQYIRTSMRVTAL